MSDDVINDSFKISQSKCLLVLHVNHALGVRVAKIGVVRRTIVNHRLVDGVCGLVREDARGETRDNLLAFVFEGRVQDVVVNLDVDSL